MTTNPTRRNVTTTTTTSSTSGVTTDDAPDPVALLKMEKDVSSLRWHAKGDYLVTVAQKATGGSSILIHQLSKAHSQQPFSKSKG